MTTRVPSAIEVAREKVRGAGSAIRAFRNWPQVLSRCVLSYVTPGASEFVARTRTGFVLRSPNDPRSRWPIFEVLAYDTYHLDRIEGLDAGNIVVLDIGAHVGAFAIGFVDRFPGAQVTCYEPAPLALPCPHYTARSPSRAIGKGLGLGFVRPRALRSPARHPLLAVGLATMKGLELLAAGAGVSFSLLRARTQGVYARRRLRRQRT